MVQIKQDLQYDPTYHYFTVVNFGCHTHHTVRVLFAEIFGKSSLVTVFTNIGDAGILFGLYFIEGLLEESYPLWSIVSRFLGLLGAFVRARTPRHLCVQRQNRSLSLR